MQFLGIEACRAQIVQEINNVFGGYGIKVSERHLGNIIFHNNFYFVFVFLNVAALSKLHHGFCETIWGKAKVF
jgi:hypothetical protein